MEMKITDDDGNELPRDGKAFGHLMVRGPFVVGEYIKGDGGQILTKTGSSIQAMSPRLILGLHADYRPLKRCHQVWR